MKNLGKRLAYLIDLASRFKGFPDPRYIHKVTLEYIRPKRSFGKVSKRRYIVEYIKAFIYQSFRHPDRFD